MSERVTMKGNMYYDKEIQETTYLEDSRLVLNLNATSYSRPLASWTGGDSGLTRFRIVLVAQGLRREQWNIG